MAGVQLADVGTALAGLSALSTASFGILDASKALGGGVGNFGFAVLKARLRPFETALKVAVGNDWETVLRSNWVAGVSKADQILTVQSLVKLGLRSSSIPDIAVRCGISAADLQKAAADYAAGHNLGTKEKADLKRIYDYIDAILSAAYAAASSRYTNWCRAAAGVVALGLALVGRALLWPAGDQPGIASTIAVGLLAVPVAPIAKDLTSGLSTAVQSLKAAARI
jgi:hypothetical protein